MSQDAEEPVSRSELLLYRTEDERIRIRIEVRLEGGTVWLTQAQMAELFQTSVQNINIHLKSIYEEGELCEAATIKDYLIVRQEGSRQVSRTVLHYSLKARNDLALVDRLDKQAMNKKDITESKNPVLAGSLPALKRAAARARKIAEQTGTRLAVTTATQAGRTRAPAEPGK